MSGNVPFRNEGTQRVDRYPEDCVLEFNSSGHHLVYVGILTRCLFEKTGKKPLFVASADVPGSAGYGIHLRSLEDRFVLHVAPRVRAGKGPVLWTQILSILSLLSELENRGVKRVWVPTGDEMALILGFASLWGVHFHRLKIKCALILLPLAYPTPSWSRRLKRRLFLWLQMRSDAELFAYDLYAVETLQKEYGIRIKGLPEPPLFPKPLLSGSGPGSRAPLEEGLCLGAIGFFDPRKGAGFLFKGFSRARFERPVKLLLAGKINDPDLAMELVKGSGSALEVIDKILTNEEYEEALGRMDILCLPYLSHIGPSGVFAQGASLGKVMVASDFGWVGWEGKKYNKVAFFRDRDLDSLTRVLEETVSNFPNLQKIQGNYAGNKEEDFTRVFCSF
jgi:glycosyltransferase involved in cell wall biosynthesis